MWSPRVSRDRRQSPGAAARPAFSYRAVSQRPSFTPEDVRSLRESLASDADLRTAREIDSDTIELPLSFDASPCRPPVAQVEKDVGTERKQDLTFIAKRLAIQCLNNNCLHGAVVNSVFARFTSELDDWNRQRRKANMRKKGLAWVSPQALTAANEMATQKLSELRGEVARWSKTDVSLDFSSESPVHELVMDAPEPDPSGIEDLIIQLDLAHVRVLQKAHALSMKMEHRMTETAEEMQIRSMQG